MGGVRGGVIGGVTHPCLKAEGGDTHTHHGRDAQTHHHRPRVVVAGTRHDPQ